MSKAITYEERQVAITIVLKDLKVIYGGEDGQVLIIGGHAISASVGDGIRETSDIDLLSNLRGAPKTVKTALYKCFPVRYSDPTLDIFSVIITNTREVQVDILSSDMFPPGHPLILRPLAGLIEGKENNFLASAFDLVVMKMFSAPIRSKGKQTTDIGDLQILLKKIQSTKSAAPPSHSEWVAKNLEQEKENHSTFFDVIKSDLCEVFGLNL